MVHTCRLLGLEPRAQAQVFNFYQACLEATIENAKRDGKYDDGIVDISGTYVTLAEPPRTVLTVRPGHRTFTTLLPASTASAAIRLHLMS